jgi:hypothetical protein
MSAANPPPPAREFTAAEKKLLARLAAKTESPYPLLENAAERTAAEASLVAELRSGCGPQCPTDAPPIAGSLLAEFNDDAGKPTGLSHLQLATGCERCGRRVSRDFALKG